MPVKDCRGRRRMSAGTRVANSTAQLPITSFRAHSFDQEHGGIDEEHDPEDPSVPLLHSREFTTFVFATMVHA